MVTRTIPHWYGLYFGADPELFISREVGKVRKGKAIIGSELVVPAKGLSSGSGSVARDGVQVELHPSPSTCRASFSAYLQSTIVLLDKAVKTANKQGVGVNPMKIDFTQLVKVTKGDLAKLTPDSRRLGCMPSFNAYGRKQIDKNGETFLTRSAAGHLHFGTPAISQEHVDPKVYAKVCDMIIGNTCVMVDRSPFAAERRRVYGKAGEYRLPKHGIEYRTLSNFWLHNYVLMSMVFGLARTAHDVACTTTKFIPPFAKPNDPNSISNAADLLMKDVDQAAVERAINTNDWELARENYEKWLKPFLLQVTYGGNIGVDALLVKDFDFFLDRFGEPSCLVLRIR